MFRRCCNTRIVIIEKKKVKKTVKTTIKRNVKKVKIKKYGISQ